MRKIVAVLPALALVSALAAGTALAAGQNEGTGAISDYCRDRGDLGLTHGACVAYFVTHNVVPHDASVCQDEAMQARVGAANHGECVKKLGEMRR